MSKTAVIFWSGSGNTEAMANAVAQGAGVSAVFVSDFSDSLDDYDHIAFGCPSMGDEVLEEGEFEPFFTSVEASISGKKVALFGSYGWGDGEWMRNWQQRVKDAGAVLYKDEGLIVNETPDDDALAACRAFGEGFAAF